MHAPTLCHQLRLNHHVLRRNLGDLSPDAAQRGPEPGGNSATWVLSHILGSRHRTLGVLGAKPLWADDEAAARFGDSAPLDALLAELDRSQDQLLEAISNVPDETLAAPAPFSPTGNPDETIGSLLAGLVFHETYHAGQTGLLRRLAGHAGAI